MINNATKENRVWIRIVNSCNSKCLFCLDSDSHHGKLIDKAVIMEQISSGYKPGFYNKIIISGGEASISPYFSEYIGFAKEVGYERIQTITNGQMFQDPEFTEKAIGSGLQEITFSIHGHTERLHDFLSGVPGSFKKALKALILIKKTYPKVILNIDIVLNRLNIDFVPDFIRFFNKIGIYEFDLLQIIPFGRSLENKEMLFYDPNDKTDIFKEIGELSKIPGMHIWTNRLPPEVLEGYENLIQDPQKIRSEILGEGIAVFEKFFNRGINPECKGENCKSCVLNDFCSTLENYRSGKGLQDLPLRSLGGKGSLSEISESYGRTRSDFLDNAEQLGDMSNMPKCINGSGVYDDFSIMDKGKKDIADFVEAYIDELYTKKSNRCRSCIHDHSCKGLHINMIRMYGYDILKPIKH